MATDAKAATIQASKLARAAETDTETFKRMSGELSEEFKTNPDFVRDVISRAKFINSNDRWYVANLPQFDAIEKNDQLILNVQPPSNPVEGNIDGLGRSIAETHENYKAAAALSQVCQSGVASTEFAAQIPAGTDAGSVYKKGEILSMSARISELDHRLGLSQPLPNDNFNLNSAQGDPSVDLPVINVHGAENDPTTFTATCDTKDTALWSNVRWDLQYMRSKLPSFKLF
jgi:hypothetical protein